MTCLIQPPDVTATENDIAAEASEQQLRPSVGIERYVIPGTEITIVRLAAGARAGDYVFSASTLNGLKGWRQTVSDLPVRDGVIVKNWVNEITNATGYRIPQWLLDAMPESLETQVFGIPLWKLIADILVLAGVLQPAPGCGAVSLSQNGQVDSLARAHLEAHYACCTFGARHWCSKISERAGQPQRRNCDHSDCFGHGRNLDCLRLDLLAGIVDAARMGLQDSPRFKDNSDGHFTRLVGKVVTVTGVMVIVWVRSRPAWRVHHRSRRWSWRLRPRYKPRSDWDTRKSHRRDHAVRRQALQRRRQDHRRYRLRDGRRDRPPFDQHQEVRRHRD